MLLASIRCSSIALGYTFNSTRALANNSHLVSLFLVPFLILLKKKKIVFGVVLESAMFPLIKNSSRANRSFLASIPASSAAAPVSSVPDRPEKQQLFSHSFQCLLSHERVEKQTRPSCWNASRQRKIAIEWCKLQTQGSLERILMYWRKKTESAVTSSDSR